TPVSRPRSQSSFGRSAPALRTPTCTRRGGALARSAANSARTTKTEFAARGGQLHGRGARQTTVEPAPVLPSNAAALATLLFACALLRPPGPGAFELPPPTGSSPVGTTRWVVTDSGRKDAFDPDRPREIEVIAWYPAALQESPSTPAPYLRAGLESVR